MFGLKERRDMRRAKRRYELERLRSQIALNEAELRVLESGGQDGCVLCEEAKRSLAARREAALTKSSPVPADTRRKPEMTSDSELSQAKDSRALDRLNGQRIEYVERASDGRLVVVFGHRGTDDDSGYLLVGESHIHWTDDSGDPDAWKAEL